MSRVEALLISAGLYLAEAEQLTEWRKAADAIERTNEELAEWRASRKG